MKKQKLQENRNYMSKQILTYLGNKRLLLENIENEIVAIKNVLNKEKIIAADLFSGSGIVARMMKKHTEKIIVNDMEKYSKLINECFLSNKSTFDDEYYNETLKKLNDEYEKEKFEGIITNNYAPIDDENIAQNERVFFTRKNAIYIDTFRRNIDKYVKDDYKKFFLAPLLIEASIHTNTSGVFKGFYKDKNTGLGIFGGTEKNSLKRIMGDIKIEKPELSNFDSNVEVYREDAVTLSSKLDEMDLVYLDPPYNQHPYGSNYFMLNIILKNEMPSKISNVSGIPTDWKRSDFNKKAKAIESLEKIVANIKAKYIILSYSSEGFITYDKMKNMLEKHGTVDIKEIDYYVFRGGRNSESKGVMLKEYLFVLRRSEVKCLKVNS